MRSMVAAMVAGGLIAGWAWYSLGATVAKWRRARADFRKARADATRLVKLLWQLGRLYAGYAGLLLLMAAAAVVGMLR